METSLVPPESGQRLKVQMKRRLRDFVFADHCAVTTHTTEELQESLNDFARAFDAFGITIRQDVQPSQNGFG